jgi:aspartate 1-decarboxylase
MLRSKIHKANVTQACLDYVGSITIDERLMKLAGLLEGERVLVVSNTSGARLETYVILGAEGSGEICMNGAAAHLVKAGEEIIVMGFELAESTIEPACVLVDAQNQFVRFLQRERANQPA